MSRRRYVVWQRAEYPGSQLDNYAEYSTLAELAPALRRARERWLPHLGARPEPMVVEGHGSRETISNLPERTLARVEAMAASVESEVVL